MYSYQDHTDESLQMVPIAIMREVTIVTEDVRSLLVASYCEFLIFLHVYTAPNIPHTSHRNVVCLVLCLIYIYTVKTVAGRLDVKLSSAFINVNWFIFQPKRSRFDLACAGRTYMFALGPERWGKNNTRVFFAKTVFICKLLTERMIQLEILKQLIAKSSVSLSHLQPSDTDSHCDKINIIIYTGSVYLPSKTKIVYFMRKLE